MMDLQIMSEHEIDNDTEDSQDAVLRHLISDVDTIQVYKVDFNRVRNGTLS